MTTRTLRVSEAARFKSSYLVEDYLFFPFSRANRLRILADFSDRPDTISTLSSSNLYFKTQEFTPTLHCGLTRPPGLDAN